MFYKGSVYSICRFLCTVVFCRILLVFSSFFLWPMYFLLRLQNHISGTMVSVLASSGEDCGFEPRSGQTKDYKIGICCFSAKNTALRSKSKDWLARNQNNVSEWNDMSIRGLLFPWSSTIKIQIRVLV